jgi:hypothetical protein
MGALKSILYVAGSLAFCACSNLGTAFGYVSLDCRRPEVMFAYVTADIKEVPQLYFAIVKTPKPI